MIGPVICDRLFTAFHVHYHVDPIFYMLGSAVTTICFLFVRFDNIDWNKLLFAAGVGFFSFVGVFPVGLLLTLLARI